MSAKKTTAIRLSPFLLKELEVIASYDKVSPSQSLRDLIVNAAQATREAIEQDEKEALQPPTKPKGDDYHPSVARGLEWFGKRYLKRVNPIERRRNVEGWIIKFALANPATVDGWFRAHIRYCLAEGIGDEKGFANSQIDARPEYRRVKMPV